MQRKESNKLINFQKYINEDSKGYYFILKVSSKAVLKSMQDGEFWFRHPAYYNYEENVNGNIEMGDKYDNKLKSIESLNDYLQEGDIQIKGALNGHNLAGKVTTREYLYSNQDEIRQISFYKLRINKDMSYNPVDSRMKKFGDYFAILDRERMKIGRAHV